MKKKLKLKRQKDIEFIQYPPNDALNRWPDLISFNTHGNVLLWALETTDFLFIRYIDIYGKQRLAQF